MDKKITPHFDRLLGESRQMQQLYAMIEKVAVSDSTVLIHGESGTGKELVAKAIHFASSRALNPFIPVNCGAIPKDLLESELFGHEKGAFTGAVTTRKGRFELADGGTILLDEIGELHPSLQVKLLRIIQEREFERVGGTKTIKVDVRILAATNKNLEEETKTGAFREDLFYRLNVIPILLPPLRDKKEDIPQLADYFVRKYSEKQKVRTIKIQQDVVRAFMKYSWPGNVRELETLIERFVILSENGEISINDLPQRFHDVEPCVLMTPDTFMVLPEYGIDLNKLLEEIEVSLITQAMEMAKGVKSRAASLLGLNRTTFLDKLRKRGFDSRPDNSNDT